MAPCRTDARFRPTFPFMWVELAPNSHLSLVISLVDPCCLRANSVYISSPEGFSGATRSARDTRAGGGRALTLSSHPAGTVQAGHKMSGKHEPSTVNLKESCDECAGFLPAQSGQAPAIAGYGAFLKGSPWYMSSLQNKQVHWLLQRRRRLLLLCLFLQQTLTGWGLVVCSVAGALDSTVSPE